MNKSDILKRTLFMSLVGSRAFGTHTEESDEDYKGIFIAEPKYYLGFSTIEQASNFEGKRIRHKEETYDRHGTQLYLSRDTEIYELKRFFGLAMQNNPSILDVLFAPTMYIIAEYKNAVNILLENKEHFLSKKCKFSFSGYAVQQLHKIEMHRKWLLDPPQSPPNPLDYGITNIELVDKSQTFAFYEYLFELMNLRIDYCEGSEMLTKEFVHLLKENVDYKQLLRTQEIPDGLLEYTAEFAKTTKDYVKLMQQIKAYIKAEEHWKNYQTWKKNRNPNRAGMEAKIGYDCYSGDTEFLTLDGWKRYDEIDEHDKLATLDDDQKVIYQNYISRFDDFFTGVMYHVKPQHSDCFITHNHKMYVSKHTRKPSNNYSTKYDNTTSNWELVPIDNLMDSKNSCYHCRITAKPNTLEYVVDDDYLILMGFYVSEGSVNKKLHKTVLRFEQKYCGRMLKHLENFKHRHEKDMKVYDVSRAYLEKTYQGKLFVYRNHEVVEKLINECGEGSYNKRLPSWTQNLSLRQAKLLLDILLSGDGTERPHSNVYYTVSKRLADSIQAMCASVGIVCQVWGPYTSISNFTNKGLTTYQVYIGENDLVKPVFFREKSTQIDKKFVENQRIVCFEVPNSILITRRNGKIAIHGNTKHAMHCLRLLRMGCEILEGKGVLVDRRQAGDVEELREIRFGNVKYDDLMDLVKREEERMDIAYQNTMLPKEPNRKLLEQVCIDIVERFV